MKTNRLRKIAAVALALVMVCSAAGASAFAAGAGPALTFTAAGRTPMSAAEVYAKNVNATVTIKVSVVSNMFGYDTVSKGGGSGFVITEDGYILTNAHVVEDASDIRVETYSGDSYEAELIGYDESNDIAVLKIDAEGLMPVTFGDSDETVVGEDVVAIGDPLGDLPFSLTKGVVSALDRDVTLSGSKRLKLIQTDCAINSGSSGGALFNSFGEVIGITTMKYSGYSYGPMIESIAFAIPVNTVVGIVEQIMTKGEISTPYMGLYVSDVGEDLRVYGIPAGANIVEVSKDSPAEEAGLKANDIITEADGKPIGSSDDLVDLVRACVAGDELTLSVYRQGETVEIVVTIGENVKSALPEKEEPARAG